MLLFFDPLALLQSAPQSSSHPFDVENVQAISLKRELLRTFSPIQQNIFTHILCIKFERGIVRFKFYKITESKLLKLLVVAPNISFVFPCVLPASANILISGRLKMRSN